MKIKFLGTAAFEGVPSLFCNCPTCRRAREAGGKNLRSRLQALVNEDLLIDFPPDTVWHSIRFGLDWQKINTCLITHSHTPIICIPRTWFRLSPDIPANIRRCTFIPVRTGTRSSINISLFRR